MVLVYSSIYAKITNDGLGEFLDDFDLDIQTMIDEIDLPGLSLEHLGEDINLDDLFEDNPNQEKEDKPKLILEYTQEDYEVVKTELLKHGKSYEQAVWNLLGLNDWRYILPGLKMFGKTKIIFRPPQKEGQIF